MKNRLAATALLATLALTALAGCGSSDSGASAGAGGSVGTASVATSAPAEGSGEADSDGAPSAAGQPSATTDSTDSIGSAGPSGDASVGSGGHPDAGTSKAPDSGSGSGISLGDKTVSDNGLGNTIVFEQVVRDFPIPAEYSAMGDDELVLVKVKVTAGSKFYLSVGQGDFQFGVEGSKYPGQQNSADGIVKAMKAAGYPPLKDVAEGKSGEGWVPGYVRPIDSGKAYVAYHRLSYSTSDGGTIPEKTWKVMLPTS